MKMYRVLLFAGMREAVGSEWISLEAGDITTVGELLKKLRQLHPDMESWLNMSRIAVNQSFVPMECSIDPTCEIALIPPVSGG